MRASLAQLFPSVFSLAQQMELFLRAATAVSIQRLYQIRLVCKPSCRLTQLLQGISITMPMNIAVFMVRHFGGASTSEQQVSRCSFVLSCVDLRIVITCKHATINTCLCQHCTPPGQSLYYSANFKKARNLSMPRIIL